MRCFALICVLMGSIVASFAYGRSDSTLLTAEERHWLEENQSRVVLAVETSYAPFVFFDTQGKPTGLAHDYIRLIESKIGASFKQRQFATLDEIFEKVRAGEVTIVNAVTKTPARSAFLTFTDPFITVPNVILVRKERSGQLREEDLRGLTVSLVKSYAVTEYLTSKALGLVPDLVTDDLTTLLNVSFGRSDAAIIDLATASYLISQKGITNLRVAGDVSLGIQLAIATPIDQSVLRGILQKGLAAITADEREAIHRRWISPATPSILTDWRLWLAIGCVLLIVLAVIAGIAVWNRMLRRQVGTRTAELEAANKELEELSYSMSHDMRSPLRAIDGYSQILLEEHGERLDEEGRRLQAAVRSNAQRMGRLIDDVLDFLKMRKRTLVIGPLDMTTMVREIFSEVEATMPAGRRLRLDVVALPPASGDRMMIQDVLRNLLSNAVKFSSPERETLIEVGGTAKALENVYLVRDNGIGFDMRYSGKLFRMFERVHPTGQYEGSGIGLAIVRRIIERHGGRVWAEGKVGEGATFHFSLPRTKT